MRTSKEMADSVLKLRDAYEEENRKRKIKMKNTAGIAAVACSFCIMAGVLLFFKSKTPDDPGMPVVEVTVTETEPVTQNAPAIGTTEEYVVKEEQAITVAETAVTEVSEVSSDVSAVTDTENTEKTEKTEKTAQTEKKAETAKQNSSQNQSDQGKKNDSASVTEKVIETNKPEAQQTKPAVTEKKPEPVTEAKKEAVTEMIVTRPVKTEEAEDESSADNAPEKKSDASAEISKETPVPGATVRPTQSSQKITESAASVQPSMRPVAEAPEPVPADAPVEEAVKVNEPESASVPSAEATVITDRNIQAAFDEVIDYTVANNTDCYLYYKDNDQILVILCRNDEDVQKINDLISEKGFDPSKFECRINDIVIDLPAQKTDDMEKQRKLISRFMTQNNIYGYAKIAEYEGEEKIIVMLNDTSSENAAKIRYFLSMYEISFNSVKIDSI